MLSYGAVTLGVFLSFMLPILLASAIRQATKYRGRSMNKYFRFLVITSAASAATGLLVLAVVQSANPNLQLSFYQYLLLGYSWDSTLQKLTSVIAEIQPPTDNGH